MEKVDNKPQQKSESPASEQAVLGFLMSFTQWPALGQCGLQGRGGCHFIYGNSLRTERWRVELLNADIQSDHKINASVHK